MVLKRTELLSVCSKAGNANLSSLNPASHLLLSLREQENLTRNSSLASVPKVRRRFHLCFCEVVMACSAVLSTWYIISLVLYSEIFDVDCLLNCIRIIYPHQHTDLSVMFGYEGHPKSFRPRHIRQQYFPQSIHQWNAHPFWTLMSRLRIWRRCNLWRHRALNRSDFQRQ